MASNETGMNVKTRIAGRLKDPRLNAIIDKIVPVVRVILAVGYVLSALAIAAVFLIITVLVFLADRFIASVPLPWWVFLLILAYIELLLAAGFVLAFRSVREELEEMVYVDMLLTGLFTGTFEMIAKFARIVMWSSVGILGLAMIVLYVQGSTYWAGVLAWVLGILVVVCLLALVVASAAKFLITKAVTSAIHGILTRLDHPLAKTALKYTKKGSEKSG